MEQRRDHDLEARIADWRGWQERTSSLSSRELDELEDHLRAHIDLEMELDATMGPARALRLASHEIGTGAALSREFAKVGGARWRRLFRRGWALYVVSFLLPSAELGFDAGYRLILEIIWLEGLFYPQVLGLIVLPNLAMLATIPAFLGRKRPYGRRAKWVLGVAGIGAVGSAVVTAGIIMISPVNRGFWDGIARFGTGYWSWTASLIVVAAALHLRGREWASAKPEPWTPSPGRGAYR